VLHDRKKVMDGEGFKLMIEDNKGNRRTITDPEGTVEENAGGEQPVNEQQDG